MCDAIKLLYTYLYVMYDILKYLSLFTTILKNQLNVKC
jgi:hypothetical protein